MGILWAYFEGGNVGFLIVHTTSMQSITENEFIGAISMRCEISFLAVCKGEGL
jgi:hypothetical protein